MKIDKIIEEMDDELERLREIFRSVSQEELREGLQIAVRVANKSNDTVILPRTLTAENGAKGLLIGEFEETIELACPCSGEDMDCRLCEGSGTYVQEVPVQWTTIKDIYKLIVEKMAYEPK